MPDPSAPETLVDRLTDAADGEINADRQTLLLDAADALRTAPVSNPSALETAAREWQDCPFCGNTEALYMAGSCVCCGRCGMEGPASGTDAEAMSLWNNRAVLYASRRAPPVAAALDAEPECSDDPIIGDDGLMVQQMAALCRRCNRFFYGLTEQEARDAYALHKGHCHAKELDAEPVGASLWAQVDREPVDQALADVEFVEPVGEVEPTDADREKAREVCGCTMCRYPVERVTDPGCRADRIATALTKAHAAGEAAAMGKVRELLLGRAREITIDGEPVSAVNALREMADRAKLPTDGGT